MEHHQPQTSATPAIQPSPFRLLIVAHCFHPEVAVGALRTRRFFKYLQAAGIDCHILAATAPGPHPQVTLVEDTLGAFWEQRARARQKGLPLPPMNWAAHQERLLRWLFPGQEAFHWARAAAEAARQWIRPGATVVLSTYPPIGTHLAAMKISRQYHCPWIADFRDPLLVPGVPYPPLQHAALRWLRSRILRAAHAVIANTDHMLTMGWAHLKKLPPVYVLWNGFDPEEQPQALPLPPRPYRLIVHTGSLYAGRNANLIVAAFERLVLSRRLAPDQLKLCLLGHISHDSYADEALYRRATAKGWLEIRPPVSRPQALHLAEQADGLLLLQPQSPVQVPAKLYEYISIGRPILALAPRNSAVEYVLQKAQVPSVCIYPDDPPAQVDEKLLAFLALPPVVSQPSKEYLEEFNARRQTESLLRIIHSLLQPPKPGA